MKSANSSVGLRDFMLTATGTKFMRSTGYPNRQIIDGAPEHSAGTTIADGRRKAMSSIWSTFPIGRERTEQIIRHEVSGDKQMSPLGRLPGGSSTHDRGLSQRGCLRPSGTCGQALVEKQEKEAA